MRIQAQRLYGLECDWREDVPDILWDDVEDENVNFVVPVGFAGVGTGAKVISTGGMVGDAVCGLDLHAQHAASDVNDKVVAVAVAPRLGDSEAERGGFAQEGGFSNLSTTLDLPLHLPGGVLLRGLSLWLRKCSWFSSVFNLFAWLPIFINLERLIPGFLSRFGAKKKTRRRFGKRSLRLFVSTLFFKDSRLDRVNAPRLD